LLEPTSIDSLADRSTKLLRKPTQEALQAGENNAAQAAYTVKTVASCISLYFFGVCNAFLAMAWQ